MDEPLSGIDFWGIIDVVGGQYLLYLAYQTYFHRSDFPDDSQLFAFIGIAAFILGGIALLIWGIRRIAVSYRQRNTPEQSSESNATEDSV